MAYKKNKDISGQEIYEYKIDHPELSWLDVANNFELTKGGARKRARTYYKGNNLPPPYEVVNGNKEERQERRETPPLPNTHQVQFKDHGHKAEAYSTSDRIKSLDQLLAACDADISKWNVTRYVVNVWEMGRKKKYVDLTWNSGVMDGYVNDTGDWQLTDLWQVKAWFEPRKEEPYEKALIKLIEDVKQYAPQYDLPKAKYADGEYLLVPNIYDAHFGKRVKYGNGGYTLEQAQHDFVEAARGIVARALSAGNAIGRIMFPIGHDLLHVDSLFDKTTYGTWVDTSSDLRDSIDAACSAATQAIEIFANVAPVDVIPVEGNHDRLQTYWLSKYLNAFFSNHDRVTVKELKMERQYYQWGKVGLGLTHSGNKPVELATLFPVEARKMWADIEWSEWLTGHFHKERGALYAVDSIRGTVVRTIPALCDTDNYHSLHLFVGQHRAAEAMFYHKENGPAGIFPVFVSEL